MKSIPKLSYDQVVRFWQNCLQTDGCWEWTGAISDFGYGVFYCHNDKYMAHRVAYSLAIGSISFGLCICHTCDNPGCVNPKHLFLGTHQDNMDDMAAKGRSGSSAGKSRPPRKLSHEQVLEIRLDSRRLKDIAPNYGVSMSLISNTKSGRRRQYE